MYDTVADDGLLSCVPLAIDDDAASGNESSRTEALCWREGVQFLHARIAILKVARIQNISLISLTRHLGVKWTHFLEWAEWADQDVCVIFTNHRWHDEITSDDPQFVRLRQYDLAVGDYFSTM